MTIRQWKYARKSFRKILKKTAFGIVCLYMDNQKG